LSGEGRRKLSRRDFLLLSGAGASLLVVKGYEKLAEGNPNSLDSPLSSVANSLGISGGGTGQNVVLVILDSLRKDCVGAYGNEWMQTPNIDALAADGLRFTRAIPEAMPTIPARRSIHTGTRSIPFRDYAPPKGENVLLYGWQPIPEEQWTLAEILASSGYATMLVSDAAREIKPSYNFQRGFGAFDFIRGQEKDLFQPTWLCLEEKIRNTLMTGNRSNVEGKMRQYFANTAYREGEEDYFAPQVFGRASAWLDGVKDTGNPFFMVIDSFDPHEPWDPPEEYISLYDEGYGGKEPYAPVYGIADYLEEERAAFVGQSPELAYLRK
jgi:arylsulfatase A-like enzyme